MTENTSTNFLSSPRLIFGALVLAAIIGYLAWHGHAGAHKADGPHAEATVTVDVATAARTDVPDYLDGLGTVQAFYTARINSRVDGNLDKVAFVEGQTVHKGELLAQIDPRPYQAALDQALAAKAKDEALLANDQRDMQRYLELAPKELASKQQVDTQRMYVTQAQAQVKADDANAENARTQLSYTAIAAPFTGRTGMRLVDPGNIVHATDTTGIVVLTQMQPIAVVFTLPEDVLPQVAAAMAHGELKVAALTRDSSTSLDEGAVTLIDNQIDQTTGTVKIKAIFPNAHLALWPGQYVTARLLVSVSKDALTIPATALQRGQDGYFAYVVNADATVSARTLKVLQAGETTVIIGSGLAPGDKVVTSNIYRLSPGAKVRIAGSGKLAERPAASGNDAS